ncbi:MAG: stage II sporulation protein P, partial [Clostridia bacterium]
KICWNNQTKIKIDANDFKNIKNPVKTADYSKPTVLIYHTHGTESYASGASYPPGYMFKSSDTEKNMIAVGNIFAAALEAHGIGVIHDKTMHDKNSYNGSYNSSEAAIKEIVKKNPTIKYTIDMHRDSVNQNGAERKIVAEIEGKKCAQIMFVVGTGHKNWKTNMAVATALQAVINEKYPTMARPIFLRTSDFNQTHAEGGMLFEVGAAGNTLEEAKNTAYFTAQALAEMIKSS